ncbi:MAG: radical SAM protein, partial [Prevotella sp.]|nr:radical SAM protein [Prevotella sp.]
MTGLYIHIPFCKSRCIYCGFYSTTRLDRQNRYVEAVCREMELRKSEVDAVGSVYLGGGTPSVLTEEQLCRIFESIERNYIYNNVYSLPSLQSGGGSEITLECNPDDVTDEFCATLRQLPVNRISMGAQTFDDARLKFLRRRHSSRQITEAVGRLRHAGIKNISIDLMYGFPGETLDEWQH